MSTDCTCETCVHACEHTPGWFAPGEAERAAALLRMPCEEFRDRYLIREYWIGDPYVYLWAPRKVGVDVGREEASWGSAFHGAPCVFLENGRCRIHAAKPMECRESMPCIPDKASTPNMRESVIVKAWRDAGNPLKSAPPASR